MKSNPAAQGLATAENNLGIMYLKGFGVSTDQAKARKWLQQAALHQSTSAQRLLIALDAQTPSPSIQRTPVTISSIDRPTAEDDADDVYAKPR